MFLLLERGAQWAEEHLPGLNWISPLKKPLSAVGMSCKVQVKSSSQWECNSLLGETMSLLVPLILFYVHTYATVKAFPCFGFVIQAYCTINWPLSLLHASIISIIISDFYFMYFLSQSTYFIFIVCGSSINANTNKSPRITIYTVMIAYCCFWNT